ncbi:UNKNOWN [Stylonychia lemnae]|uniref:MRH domain-containing protein n=1 Tax=Stylonychia lemnae TaxID=5949 RepID=A0A078AUA5_STYLE|nr:UNKNOWN [Stylonychia lemnae]|eukprot:CDW84817.1 UNKNOWN [Stylonychia lemnae]
MYKGIVAHLQHYIVNALEQTILLGQYNKADRCFNYTMMQPLNDIPCQHECKAGQYLHADNENRTFGCKDCPVNTFSTGGGLSVDGSFGQWLHALQNTSEFIVRTKFASKCYMYFWSNWIEEECLPCQVLNAGQYLSCGEASARETSVAHEIVFELFFYKKGKLSLIYRKDTVREIDGWMSGIFEIYIDQQLVFQDQNLDDDQIAWKSLEIDIEPGIHEVIISYQKYNSAQNSHQSLDIQELRLTGLEYADLECKPCEYGYSLPGSSQCSLCPKDTFLNPEQCVECPEGTFCAQGAVAINAADICTKKRECSLDEIPIILDQKCYQDERTLWSRNFTYDYSSVTEEVCGVIDSKKILTTQQMDCDSCEAGSIRVQEGNTSYCEPCYEGSYAADWMNKKCQDCQPGHYLEKGLFLSKFLNIPEEYGFSTNCRDKDGLKCKDSNGFLAKYNRGLIAGNREQEKTITQLNINVEIFENEDPLFQNQRFEIFYKLEKFSNSSLDYFNITVNKRRVLITKIILVGSKHHNMGATRCLKCPTVIFNVNKHFQSFFSDQAKSDTCRACPQKMTSTNGNDCVKCPEDRFSFGPGSLCFGCPENTYVSENQTHCVPNGHLLQLSKTQSAFNVQQPFVYHLSQFSSKLNNESNTDPNSADYRVCKGMGQFCQHGYFGPIYSNIKTAEDDYFFKNQFFVSPTALSDFWKISDIELELSQDDRNSFLHNSFIIGLYDQNAVEHYSTLQSPGLGDKCPSNLQGKNQRIVKSLGTNIRSISIQDNAFTVHYNHGDLCFYDQNQKRFQSEIKFVCDHNEDEGWPILIKPKTQDALCNVQFVWKSKYACRQCFISEVSSLKGPCIAGERKVQLQATNECLLYSQSYLDDMSKMEHQPIDYHSEQVNQTLALKSYAQSCSFMDNYRDNRHIITIVFVSCGSAIFLIFLSIILIFRYKKFKYIYYEKVELLKSKDTHRNNFQTIDF